MKKRTRMRGCALLLSLLLAASAAGCSAKPSESENEVSSKTEVSVVKKEAESQPESMPSPTPETASENISMLTGLPTLTAEAVGKRPIAVMVNNVKAALPQYGISAADVVFELPVEGDVTRLMALYSDYTKVPDVCSIRSCRYYYPILALGFDAVYVHWGIDPTIATETVNYLDLDRFDGMNGGSLYSRDQDRLNSGYALEHTGVFHGGNIQAALKENGIRTELAEEYQEPVFNFAAYGKSVVPAGQTANNINVDFGATYSTFSYDAKKHNYKKTHTDEPHMDAVSGEQLAFENLLILETDISVRDEKGRKNVNWQGGEGYTGVYVSEGKSQPITWSKADEYSKIEIFDAEGKPLVMNRGKTYIGMTYFDYYTISE